MKIDLQKLLETGEQEGLIGNLAHRLVSIRKTIELLRELRTKKKGKLLFIETGTCSSKLLHAQGCSTPIFAQLAKELNADFFSVDRSGQNIFDSQSIIFEFGYENFDVNYWQQDSIEFFNGKVIKERIIDFLYLDSYDFYPGSEEQSRVHQLNEIQAAYPSLRDGSIVLLDDANPQIFCKEKLEGKNKEGKTFFSHQYLISRGSICLADYPSYQRLYIIKK